jgi:hypothetical protein
MLCVAFGGWRIGRDEWIGLGCGRETGKSGIYQKLRTAVCSGLYAVLTELRLDLILSIVFVVLVKGIVRWLCSALIVWRLMKGRRLSNERDFVWYCALCSLLWREGVESCSRGGF